MKYLNIYGEWEKYYHDPTLKSLTRGASRKRQRLDFPPGRPERTRCSWYLVLCLARWKPFETSDLQTCKATSCCFKPVTMWRFGKTEVTNGYVLLVCSFIQSFMPLWGAGSYFALSNYNPRLNFLLQSVLALAGENSLKVSLGATSADPHHCGRFLAFRLFVCLFV